MKKILFIALCLISLTGFCQVKDSVVGDTHYIPFPTGVVSTADTVNYVYKIPYFSQWAWEYYQTKTTAHDSISYSIYVCSGPPYWIWQLYPDLVKKVKKQTADTITCDDPLGTALPYIMLRVCHYATDTALVKSNRLIYKIQR